jgi:hypothetical protein
MLPDARLSLYLPKSERSGIPDDIVCRELDQIGSLNVDRLYRWGRAAGFHEFDIAIGLDHVKVVADDYPSALDHSVGRREPRVREGARLGLGQTRSQSAGWFCATESRFQFAKTMTSAFSD